MRNRPGPVAAGDRDIADPSSGSSASSVAVATKLTSFQLVTLIGLAVMAVSVIGFGWDIGIVTITIGVVLATLGGVAFVVIVRRTKLAAL